MEGINRTSVVLSDYDTAWVQRYEYEKMAICAALENANMTARIEHVGSTSVVGLNAKPIIDIAIGVASFDEVRSVANCLCEAIGYELRLNGGGEDRLLLAKGDEQHRTCYIHIEPIHSESWVNHIVFRDYLSHNPTVLADYADLKRQLAKYYPEDRASYTKAKSDFIASTISTALSLGYHT